jgi:hypothetical protein
MHVLLLFTAYVSSYSHMHIHVITYIIPWSKHSFQMVANFARSDDRQFLVFWLATDISYSSVFNSNGTTVSVRCPSPYFYYL